MSHSEVKELFEGKWYAHPVLRNALIAGGLTGIAYALGHLGFISPAIETGLYAIAVPLGGYHWMREGIKELAKEKEVGIKILMLAATVGSVILRMVDEAAFLVFLYGAAEGLEEYTYARTRASIRKLLNLAPKEARVLREGQDNMIPASALVVGDVFRVKPGESLATDGIVIAGRSSVNEAQVLGVLGEHGREYARDKVTIIPNGADQTHRCRIDAGSTPPTSGMPALAADMTAS